MSKAVVTTKGESTPEKSTRDTGTNEARPIDPDAIDPDARYVVRIARPLTVGGARLLPREDHTMTGAFLRAVIDEEGRDAVRRADIL